MTKVVPATIAAMIAVLPAECMTLARCAKVTLRDGTEWGFTDHDRDLVVSLESDLYEPVRYQAGMGLIVGDIDLALGLSADSTEIAFPFGGLVQLRQVVGRRLNHATVHLFDVDWADPTPTAMELMKGQVNDARGEGPMAICEVRSQGDYWNQVIGELMAPRCSADFGDSRCKKIVAPVPCVVAAVESTQRFHVDLAGQFAEQFFRFGTVKFVTGGLADVWSEEVFNYNGEAGLVELTASLPDAPEVGDELLIKVGCSRLKVHSDPLVQTCATHANVINFRGYDRVPGSDVYFRMPIPGQGNK